MLWHHVLSPTHVKPFPNNPNPSKPRATYGFSSISLVGEFHLPLFLPTSPGQILYGRVLWHPEQNLNAAYKLQLEKVYLCTGRDGYVPFFDPTGTVYNEGPQYGCIQPNKYLKHRFLLLVSPLLLLPTWDFLWRRADRDCKGMREEAWWMFSSAGANCEHKISFSLLFVHERSLIYAYL